MTNGFEILIDEEDKNNRQISEAKNLLASADKMFSDCCLTDDTIGKFFELEFAKPYKFDAIEAIKNERNRLEMMGLVPSGGWKKLPFEIDGQNDEKSQELLRRRAKEPEKGRTEIAVNREDKRSSLQRINAVKHRLEEFIESVKVSEAEVKTVVNEVPKLAFQKPPEQVADRPVPTCKCPGDKVKLSESSISDEYSYFSISEYSEKIDPRDDIQEISTSQVIKKVAKDLEKAGAMAQERGCDIPKKEPEELKVNNAIKSKAPGSGNKTYRSSRSRGTVISALRSTVNRHQLDKIPSTMPEHSPQTINPGDSANTIQQPVVPESTKQDMNVSKKVKIRRRLKL
ncbi:MAG: hypothetical protein LBI37_03440 [Puniceicoccales bacterium]|jgi:hypothetical protein|nr:hypothetical protein [Puniceicoccales bacterium]